MALCCFSVHSRRRSSMQSQDLSFVSRLAFQWPLQQDPLRYRLLFLLFLYVLRPNTLRRRRAKEIATAVCSSIGHGRPIFLQRACPQKEARQVLMRSFNTVELLNWDLRDAKHSESKAESHPRNKYHHPVTLSANTLGPPSECGLRFSNFLISSQTY